MSELRYLMKKYLKETFGETAHAPYEGVLADFVNWVECKKDSEILTNYLNDKLSRTTLEGRAQVSVE
jgi:hypothetical protein